MSTTRRLAEACWWLSERLHRLGMRLFAIHRAWTEN